MEEEEAGGGKLKNPSWSLAPKGCGHDLRQVKVSVHVFITFDMGSNLKKQIFPLFYYMEEILKGLNFIYQSKPTFLPHLT